MALPSRTQAGRFAAGLLLVLVAPVLTGCSDDEPASERPEPADADTGDGDGDGKPADAGRAVRAANGEILVPTEPQRIVALSVPTLSALVELGHEPVAVAGDPDSLEAVGSDGVDLESIEVFPSPAELTDADVERLANLEPDLVIGPMTARDFPPAVLAALSKTAPTTLFEWNGSGSWQDHMADVADVMAADPALDAAKTAYSERAAQVRSALGDREESGAVAVTLADNGDLHRNTANSMAGQVLREVGFEPLVDSDDGADDERLPLTDTDLASGSGIDHVFVLTSGSGAEEDDGSTALETGSVSKLRQAWPDAAIHAVDEAHWSAGSYHAAQQVLDDIDAMATGG